MANATGIHELLSANSTASPLTLTTGNTVDQNFRISNMMGPGGPNVFARGHVADSWSVVEPKESLAVTVRNGQDLMLAVAGPSYRYISIDADSGAPKELPVKVQVSAGAIG
jgi:hypothetical protein